MSDNGVNYEAAAEITRKLAEIEKSYQDAGGSSNVSMQSIRNSFAEVIPYNSKNWYRHWSNFAVKLLKLDRDAHRPLFRNQNPIPTSTPRSDDDPLYIFNPLENTVYPPDLSRAPSPVPPSTQDVGTDTGREIPRVLSTDERVAALSKQNKTEASQT
ncbi:hypothetical protein DFH28DRAFT_939112 [Melampsora americana]|nr:hypothetical protein DFH28DRAFT_939112 [Melampsora americana]